MDDRTTFELRDGDEIYTRDDQPLGRIADVGWNYLDLATGFLGMQHLYVPSSAVDHVDFAQRRIYLNLDRDQVPTEAWRQQPVDAGPPAGAPVVEAIVVESAPTPTMAGTMPSAAPGAPAPPAPPAPPLPTGNATGAGATETAAWSAPEPTRPPMEELIEDSAEARSRPEQPQEPTIRAATTPAREAAAPSASPPTPAPAGTAGAEQRMAPAELTSEQLRGRMLYDWDGHALGHLEGREPDYFEVQTPIVDLGPTLYVPPDAIKYCTRFGCYLGISLEEIKARNWNEVPAEALDSAAPPAPALSASDVTMDVGSPPLANEEGPAIRIPYFEDEDAAKHFREGSP